MKKLDVDLSSPTFQKLHSPSLQNLHKQIPQKLNLHLTNKSHNIQIGTIII